MMRKLLWICFILMATVTPALAQDAAPTSDPTQEAVVAPPALYVLSNAGQVSRLDVDTLVVTPITPPPDSPDSFIIDMGIDAQGERLAYRTPNGLFVRSLSSGAVRSVEGTSAGLPAFRGSGDTIAFAPPGDAIAYTTLSGARVLFETGSTPIFAELREGIFVNLSWSPGGTFLAGAVEGGIWWVYRRDGAALTLSSVVSSATGIAWISDVTLAFTPIDGGMRLMRLDQANAQDVILDDSVLYDLPTLTAGDALAFFGRAKADAALPAGFARLLRLGRGAAEIQTLSDVPIALANLRWVPGGSLLLAFQGGAMALLDPVTGEILTLPFADAVAYVWSPLNAPVPQTTPQDPALPLSPPTDEIPVTAVGALPTLQPTPLPAIPTPTAPPAVNAPPSGGVSSPAIAEATAEAAADVTAVPTSAAPLPVEITLLPVIPPTPTPFSAAPPLEATPVTGVSSSAEGFFLAPDPNGTVQVWWLPRTGLPATRFTDAASDVGEFAVAPGGRRVAFVTFDADGGTIWLQRFEFPQPLLLGYAEAFAPTTPDFSPDGTLIAYSDESPIEGGIWLLSIDGQGERLVPNTPGRSYRRPQFSPEGDKLLLDVYLDDGAVVSAVVDLAARTIIEAPPDSVSDQAGASQWLTGGRYLVPRANVGLHVYDAAAPGVSPQVIDLPPDAPLRSVAEAAPGQLRAALALADGDLRVIDVQMGQQAEVGTLPGLIAPRFSPDGAFAAGYTSIDESEGVLRGQLVVISLDTGARFVLSQPQQVWAFRWAR
jgi:hypothetical protein